MGWFGIIGKFALGAGGFVLGNWQRLVIYGVVILAVVTVVWGHGYMKGSQRLFEYQAEQAKLAVKIITKIQKVIEEVLVEHVKVETKIVTVFERIREEVPHVPVRPMCNATRGWVHLHDAAASADRPDAAAVDDAGDSGVTEAQVIEAVVTNYKSYHQVANDLRACRSAVRGIAKITGEVPE